MFGGKAAPGYAHGQAHHPADHRRGRGREQRSADVRRLLKVVFLPDFNVKNAQRIYPAADLSEQISTAGKEASGTGNMKFTMNGALTIGTLDGANVEIREEVGAENFFLFGLTAERSRGSKRAGLSPARAASTGRRAARSARSDRRADSSRAAIADLFRPLVDNLLHADPFLVLADYAVYVDCQDRVNAAWRDRERWTRMSILNTRRARENFRPTARSANIATASGKRPQ